MANNKQDDKTQAEDQAFIQSLYDDLSDQQDDDPTEQPSKELDRRIIAAAHKAVATEQANPGTRPKNSNNVETLKQAAGKGKKIAWYYPAAMAASVLLLVTVVNHQLKTPIPPGYEAPSVSMDSVSRSRQSDPLPGTMAEKDLRSFSAQPEPTLVQQQAVTDEIYAEDFDGTFADSEQALIASVELPVSADKKAIQGSDIEQLPKAEMASEPDLTASQPRTESESVMVAAKAKQAPLSPTTLSGEEYKTLQAQSEQQSLYWLLRQEDDTSYVIELFITEHRSLFYRLHKNNFKLNSSSTDKKQPFAAITFIRLDRKTPLL